MNTLVEKETEFFLGKGKRKHINSSRFCGIDWGIKNIYLSDESSITLGELKKHRTEIIDTITTEFGVIIAEDLTGLIGKEKTPTEDLEDYDDFLSELKEKLIYKNGFFMLVDPAYTSQTCVKCRTPFEEMKDQKKCPNCGLEKDRNISAAKNIRDRGFFNMMTNHNPSQDIK